MFSLDFRRYLFVAGFVFAFDIGAVMIGCYADCLFKEHQFMDSWIEFNEEISDQSVLEALLIGIFVFEWSSIVAHWAWIFFDFSFGDNNDNTATTTSFSEGSSGGSDSDGGVGVPDLINDGGADVGEAIGQDAAMIDDRHGQLIQGEA